MGNIAEYDVFSVFPIYLYRIYVQYFGYLVYTNTAYTYHNTSFRNIFAILSETNYVASEKPQNKHIWIF